MSRSSSHPSLPCSKEAFYKSRPSVYHGSSPLLVIQVHGSKIATSEERVANWKILVHQWRNEHSFRDELSHHLVFTKNDEEPTSFTPVGNSADSRGLAQV